jgi:hypothetical protein
MLLYVAVVCSFYRQSISYKDIKIALTTAQRVYNEAKRLNIDMRWGITLDKMAIQEELKMIVY